jgi:hypothetical protein
MAPRAATMSPSGRLALTYGADERVPVLTIWDYTKEFPLAPPQQLGEATFRLIQRSLSAADSTEVVRCPNVAGLDGLLLQVSSRAEIIHSFKYDAQIDAAPSAPRSRAIVSHCVATTPAPPEVHPPWEQAHTCGWTVRWFARRAIGCCVTPTRADDRRGPQEAPWMSEREGRSPGVSRPSTSLRAPTRCAEPLPDPLPIRQRGVSGGDVDPLTGVKDHRGPGWHGDPRGARTSPRRRALVCDVS